MRAMRSLIAMLVMMGLLLSAAPEGARGAEKADTAKLIAVLESKTTADVEKDEAIRMLTRLGAPEAVPALAALLDHRSLATLARGGLEAMPGPEAGAALRQALGKLEGRALVGVLCSLGNRRDGEAIGEFKKFLTHKDDDVAAAAAMALAKSGSAEQAAALEAALAAAPAGRKAALADACLLCAQALATAGKHAEAQAVYDRLRAAELPEHVKRAALLGAIRERGEGGAALAAECLASADWMQFGLGLQASRLIPGAAMTKAMLAALEKAPADKQPLIVKALADRGDPEILPAAIGLARQGDPALRAEAIQVIGRRGGVADVPLLFELACDPAAPVAEAAKAVLTGLAGAEVDQAVMERIKAGDAAVRLLALELAGKRAIKTAGGELIKLAADPERKVRQAALRALGDGGGAEDMTALLNMMMKAEAGEQAEVESAIRSIAARLGDPKAAAGQILALLPKAQGAQRAALLRLAGTQGTPEALEAVRQGLKDPDAKVGDAAFRALCDWPGPEAAGDLLALAKAPGPGTRPVLALRAYIRLAGSKAVAPAQRIAMLRQAAALAKGNGEKKQLLGALQAIPNPATLTLVLPHLDNPELRAEAALAAVTIAEKLSGARMAKGAGAGAMAKAMEKAIAGADDPAVKARAQAVRDRLAGAAKQ